MHYLPHSQDLPAEEIARLLEQQGQEVPAALMPDLKVLMDEMAGIDDTHLAVERPNPQRIAA